MATPLDPRAAGGKRLKDKVCIVTGAGQGIGRATAKRLGAEGGTIVVADRVDEGATQTMAELRDHGVEALKVLVDSSTLTGAQGSDEARRSPPMAASTCWSTTSAARSGSSRFISTPRKR